MRLGVFGGTFDPPHVGHLLLAERAREQLGLERVLWVPAGDPWRKSDRQVAAAKDRVEMVRRAVEGNESFEVCTLEVERKGPTYSIETLEVLREKYQEAELVFLVGEDALLDLPYWREAERLLELATLGVARRREDDGAQGGLAGWLRERAVTVEWIDMPRIAISSTEIRRRVAEGQTIRYAVPEAVEAYIRQQRLYIAG